MIKNVNKLKFSAVIIITFMIIILLPIVIDRAFSTDVVWITTQFTAVDILQYAIAALGIVGLICAIFIPILNENHKKREERKEQEQAKKREELSQRRDLLLNQISNFYSGTSLRRFKEIFLDAYEFWQKEPDKFYASLDPRRLVLGMEVIFSSEEKKLLQNEIDTIVQYADATDIILTKMYRCFVEIKDAYRAIESSRNLLTHFEQVVDAGYKNYKNLCDFDFTNGYKRNSVEEADWQETIARHKKEMNELFLELDKRKERLANANSELVSLHTAILELISTRESEVIDSFDSLVKKINEYFSEEISKLAG